MHNFMLMVSKSFADSCAFFPSGAKGAGHSRQDRLANGKPEEPAGLGGRRQSSVGGTSRMSCEVYVRFCERLGVKFPGPTRLRAFIPFVGCRIRLPEQLS